MERTDKTPERSHPQKNLHPYPKAHFPERLACGNIELIRLSLRNDPGRFEECLALYTKNREHLKPWHYDREELQFKNSAAMKKYIKNNKLSWHAVYHAGTMAGLIELCWKDDEIRLAYWMDAEYTRRGIMHAAIAMTEQALSGMGIDTVHAEILLTNEPSIKLLQKLNYETMWVSFHISESGQTMMATIICQKIL